MRVEQSYECLNACLVNQLTDMGIRMNGSVIEHLGDGYKLTYVKKSLYRITSDICGANYRFLKQLKIPYEHQCSKEGKPFLVRCVNENKSIAIRTSTEYLSYSPVFQYSPGVLHFLNITDYRKSGDEFFVKDGSIPSDRPSCFQGWVKAEKLIPAWRATKCEYLIVDWGEKDRLYEKIKECMERERNLRKEAIEYYIQEDHPWLRHRIHGKNAVIQMLRDLADIWEESDARLAEVVREVNFNLRMNGFIKAKQFIMDSIPEEEQKLRREYNNVIEEWMGLCACLVKATNPIDIGAFHNIEKQVEALLDKEMHLLKNIEQIC